MCLCVCVCVCVFCVCVCVFCVCVCVGVCVCVCVCVFCVCVCVCVCVCCFYFVFCGFLLGGRVRDFPVDALSTSFLSRPERFHMFNMQALWSRVSKCPNASQNHRSWDLSLEYSSGQQVPTAYRFLSKAITNFSRYCCTMLSRIPVSLNQGQGKPQRQVSKYRNW